MLADQVDRMARFSARGIEAKYPQELQAPRGRGPFGKQRALSAGRQRMPPSLSPRRAERRGAAVPLAVGPLVGKQSGAPTFSSHTCSLGGDLLRGGIGQVPHHLPADGRVRVEQPVDCVHRVLKYWFGMLKQEQLAHFRQKLVEERGAIERRIASRETDIMDTVRDEEGVGDEDDEAVRIYDREDELVSNELDTQQLEQVKKALARIEAGTYGVSEVSGKPIPIERLEAVPSATTLVTEESA